MPLIPCFNCNPAGDAAGDPACPYCSGQGHLVTDTETALAVAVATIRKLREPAPRPARYIVQLVVQGPNLLAVANDGTPWVWDIGTNDWEAGPPLPQGEVTS